LPLLAEHLEQATSIQVAGAPVRNSSLRGWIFSGSGL